MANIVTAPLVITKREDGSDQYLYEGSELPEHLDKDEVKRLTELGLVESAKSSSK